MAIDPEIRPAIEAIDRKIAKLKQARDLLVSEFAGGQDLKFIPPPPPPPQPLLHPPPDEPKLDLKGTRKQQIAAFLRARGPQTRSEIVEKTSIPVGTVAYVLNDGDLFANVNGKWRLKNDL